MAMTGLKSIYLNIPQKKIEYNRMLISDTMANHLAPALMTYEYFEYYQYPDDWALNALLLYDIATQKHT